MILNIILETLKYKIDWKIPNFEDELGEYFENEYTKNFFYKHGIIFNSDKELLKILKSGKLIEINKSEVLKNSNNISSPEEFEKELKDSEYSESFNSMELNLKNNKILNLPAPILFKFKNFYFGFAGNRRMNLAWKYNIPIKFWVVTL